MLNAKTLCIFKETNFDEAIFRIRSLIFTIISDC